MKLAAAEAVEDAHREFATSGKQFGITELWDLEEQNGQLSFIFSDLDRNWWEAVATEDGSSATVKTVSTQQAAVQETTGS